MWITERVWPGHYYDGQTACQHTVTVYVQPTGLELRFEDGRTSWWPYPQLTQTLGFHSGEPVRLERGTGLTEALLVQDAGFLKALSGASAVPARQFRSPSSRGATWLFIVTGGLASILCLAGVALWVIPTLSQHLAPLIPKTWEVRLGATVVAHVENDSGRCTNQQLQETIRLLLERLIPDPSSYQFHVSVVDTEVVNAFAAPGGFIVVHRPLLRATDSPEELAGILAHEIQHVTRRHTLKALIGDLSLVALIGAAFGDVTGLGAIAITASQTVVNLRYSREAEEEADREGADLLRRAGVDIGGMAKAFEMLKVKGGSTRLASYLSTHPDIDRRIAALHALQAKGQPDVRPLLPHTDWGKVRDLCY